MSKRQDILEAFKTRAEDISVANGYNTDAGLTVYMGEEITLGPDDVTSAIDISPGPESLAHPDMTGAKTPILWRIDINALAAADLTSPWESVYELVEDIENAVELADNSLGGLVHEMQKLPMIPFDREEGATYIGAAVSYQVLFTHSWGSP